MRKPVKRNFGRYEHKLDGIEEYAKEVAKNVCEMYPDTDVIDLRQIFIMNLEFSFAMELMQANLQDRIEAGVYPD